MQRRYLETSSMAAFARTLTSTSPLLVDEEGPPKGWLSELDFRLAGKSGARLAAPTRVSPHEPHGYRVGLIVLAVRRRLTWERGAAR
jgi:hypothetical protein